MNRAFRSTDDLICEVDRFSYMKKEMDYISYSMFHDTLMSSIAYSTRAVSRHRLKHEQYESKDGFIMVKYKIGSNAHTFGVIDTRGGNECLLGLSNDPTRLRTLYMSQPLTIAGKDHFMAYMRRCGAHCNDYLKQDPCQVRMLSTVKTLKAMTVEIFSSVPVWHQQLGRVYTASQPIGAPRQKSKGQVLFRLITEYCVLKCCPVTVISLYDWNSRRVMSTLDYGKADKVAALSSLSMLRLSGLPALGKRRN